MLHKGAPNKCLGNRDQLENKYAPNVEAQEKSCTTMFGTSDGNPAKPATAQDK